MCASEWKRMLGIEFGSSARAISPLKLLKPSLESPNLFFLKRGLFIFNLYVLLACICAPHVCPVPVGTQKVSDPLELKLEMDVRCHVIVGN